MTQTDPTRVPGGTDHWSDEVEETVTTRVNPDGTLTKITTTRSPNGSVAVVEETTQRDGRKTITMKEYATNTDPTTAYAPANNFQRPTTAPRPTGPSNFPAATGGEHYANPYPAHCPSPARQQKPAHRPNKRVDSDEEMCCGDFPNFGTPAECRPTKHPVAKEGEIKWAWCPTFSWLKVIFITSWMITLLGIVMMSLSFGNAALLAVGIIFFVGGLVMVFIFGIWKWDADKQAAYKIARGKCVEALALWKDVDPQFHYQAKDKQDPTAPKRPMSAFLFFSQGTRQKIKEEKPHLKNTEISSILGEMWKNLSDEERKPHIEREVREREQYKKEMAVWREKRAGEEEAEKKRKDAIVSEFIKSGFVPGSNPPSMPMPIEGGPAMLPQMPTPMAPGMMPFPPMMMPPGMAPMPMAMPPNIEGAEQVTEGGQDQQQQVGQSIYHGSQPQNQPPYQGYYYPMYPYPYPHMVMPPPGMYPVIPQPQQDVEGGGGPAVPYTEAGNGSG